MANTSQSSDVDRPLTIVTVIILIIAITLALRQDGVARAAIDRWHAGRRERQAARAVMAVIQQRLGMDTSTVAAASSLIVEVADYQCPYCRTMQPVLDGLAAQGHPARILQLHYPLSSHPQARAAALAAICADSLGVGDSMHKLLYQRDDWYTAPQWIAIGAAAGATDTAALAGCITGSWARERLLQDSLLSVQLGVRATPTFLANGRLHTGAMTGAELDAFLQR